MQLREKQKAKFIYGVLEKQFHAYYEKAVRMPGISADNLMCMLETRLDSVVFRLGFAKTRREARQAVSHGRIQVNGRRVDIPSYAVRMGDVISVAPKAKDMLVIKSALVAAESRQVPAGSSLTSTSCRAPSCRFPRAIRLTWTSRVTSSSSSTRSNRSPESGGTTCQSSSGPGGRSRA